MGLPEREIATLWEYYQEVAKAVAELGPKVVVPCGPGGCQTPKEYFFVTLETLKLELHEHGGLFAMLLEDSTRFEAAVNEGARKYVP